MSNKPKIYAPIATGSTEPRDLRDRFADVVNVKDFGAVGDGVTDDTAAIQAAINYASIPSASDYWGQVYKEVYVPDGVYSISGISIPAPIKFRGAGFGATTISKQGNSKKHAITIEDFSGIAHNDTYRQSAQLENFTLNCGGSGASPAYNGIHLADSVTSMTDTYVGSVIMQNVIVRAVDGTGLYGGKNRNAADLSRCLFLYCTGKGVECQGFDWRMDRCDIGNCGGEGLYIQGGAITVDNTYIYMCRIGVTLSQYAYAPCFITSCYIDTNETYGVYISGSGGDIAHIITGCVFRDNGTGAYNTYSAVYVENMPGLVLTNNIFKEDMASARVKYLVESYNSYEINFSGSTYSEIPGETSQAINITNDFSALIYTGDSKSGSGKILDPKYNYSWGKRWYFGDTSLAQSYKYWCWDVEEQGKLKLHAAVDDGQLGDSAIVVNKTGYTPQSVEILSVTADGGGFATKTVYPKVDNEAYLGMWNNRWKEMFSATAVINTSDAREKVNFTDPDEALMRAWGKVNFKAFQFIDAVNKKGEEARMHLGVVAQQVAEAFASEGLDASRYALFCYDKWDDEYKDVEVVDVEATYDENGNELTPQVSHIENRLVIPAGDRYGIRYSEALALEAAYQRWLGEQRDKEIAELKAMLTNFKSTGYTLS